MSIDQGSDVRLPGLQYDIKPYMCCAMHENRNLFWCVHDVIMDTRAENGLEMPMHLPYNLCFRLATSVFRPFFYPYV